MGCNHLRIIDDKREIQKFTRNASVPSNEADHFKPKLIFKRYS